MTFFRTAGIFVDIIVSATVWPSRIEDLNANWQWTLSVLEETMEKERGSHPWEGWEGGEWNKVAGRGVCDLLPSRTLTTNSGN